MDAEETPTPQGTIALTNSNRSDALLSARGAFDRDNRNTLIGFVEATFADGHRAVALDVAGVTFIDAAVVNALVNCEEDARVQGRTLRLLHPSPAVAQVLADTGTFAALSGHRRGPSGATAHPRTSPVSRRDAVIARAYEVLAASRRMAHDIREV
ncbi:STAS domain-containing protein [Paractinoplanes hotanensis]|uniref:STAS domain-containing protein n=1 Tax=Paractinoplanes hotanensis TaxID=2906497 RepID=A0ABT0Y670_9ACTN|nr:STAS domain-containing protein [Actinoplanes hotanensis]MCM4081524.1 STAS domain-containing protein [Actinoplanes hotanensis]